MLSGDTCKDNNKADQGDMECWVWVTLQFYKELSRKSNMSEGADATLDGWAGGEGTWCSRYVWQLKRLVAKSLYRMRWTARGLANTKQSDKVEEKRKTLALFLIRCESIDGC